MEFAVVDVETANPDLASICQVGVARFEDGRCVDVWERLVDPRDRFDRMNMAVHRIREADVAGAPTLPELFGELVGRLDGPVVASHTAFDRAAVCRAASRHGLAPPSCSWLDTARVVRHAWPDLARQGCGLGKVAKALGIDFVHHRAGEDARAAGEVLLRAVADTGVGVEDWLRRARLPARPGAGIAREGDPDGPLAGEVIVFTGALSMKRKRAAELSVRVGCAVADAVTEYTTLLVVGDQDLRKLAGHEKSSKHRKAEALMGAGYPIRILQESDFLGLVALG
jgi:DNA polymerase-3 subunit epsilon